MNAARTSSTSAVGLDHRESVLLRKLDAAAVVDRDGPSRILIIKPSSLGDIVHALPAVHRIRCAFPDAHIAWLINPEFASLLEHSPIVNRVIHFPRRRLSHMPALIRRLRREQFDCALDLQGLLRSGLIAQATLARRRVGLSDSRECARFFHNEIIRVPRCHAVDRYLLAADHLHCPKTDIEFPLGLDPNIKSEGWIAINPSARWPSKMWGDHHYAELIRRLPRDCVVMTGAAKDRQRLDHIAPGVRNIAGTTNLRELAAFYASCSVLVTNDTGPMHIAAAVGIPVVAIFGPTDPALTGPYGSNHIVLREPVACSPCFRKQCPNRIPMECMTQITVDRVMAALEPILCQSA